LILEGEDYSQIIKSWLLLNTETDINTGFNDKKLERLADIDLTYFLYKEEMIREYYKILPQLREKDMDQCLQEYRPIDISPGQQITWDKDFISNYNK
jgi:hypothetical protein